MDSQCDRIAMSTDRTHRGFETVGAGTGAMAWRLVVIGFTMGAGGSLAGSQRVSQLDPSQNSVATVGNHWEPSVGYQLATSTSELPAG